MIEKQCERPGCSNTFWVEEHAQGKPKRYCSGRCRQIVSRLQKARQKREVQDKLVDHLRKTWKRFSPEVQEKLEELLRFHHQHAAQLATDALVLLEQEGQALARVRYREGYEQGKQDASSSNGTPL